MSRWIRAFSRWNLRGRIARHEDNAGNMKQRTTVRDPLCVIARACTHHAPASRLLRHLPHAIVRSANFVRTHNLQVFALQKDPRPKMCGQAFAKLKRRLTHDVLQAFVRGFNIGKGY